MKKHSQHVLEELQDRCSVRYRRRARNCLFYLSRNATERWSAFCRKKCACRSVQETCLTSAANKSRCLLNKLATDWLSHIARHVSFGESCSQFLSLLTSHAIMSGGHREGEAVVNELPRSQLRSLLLILNDLSPKWKSRLMSPGAKYVEARRRN